MPASFVLDSSVLLYLPSNDDPTKKAAALHLFKQKGFTSPQVVFECLNVCLRKYKFTKADAVEFAELVCDSGFFVTENEVVTRMGFALFAKYFFQPFDGKIVASALVAGCTTLYSEDMQHGLVIENSLTIINPFL